MPGITERLRPFLLGVLLLVALGWMGLNTFYAWQKQQRQNGLKTIVLSTWGSEQERAILNPMLRAFEQAHSGVKVQVRHMPEFYTQSLQMLVAANQAPDVMMLNSLDIKRFCQANILSDLRHVPMEGFYPRALESLALKDGTQCALPRDVSVLVMFINRTMLARLPASVQALAHPGWRLKEMEALAQAATQPATFQSPKRWGLGVYQAPALFWLPYVWSEGGQWFDAQGHIQVQAAEKDVLERYKAYSTTMGISPKRTETANTTMSELFTQQRLLMMPSGRWSVPFLRENAAFQWDVLPFPAGRSGSRVGVDATGYALSRSSRHPQEAQALIEYLTGPEAQAQWAASGLVVPSQMTVAESPTFLQPTHPPRNANSFLQAMRTGVPSPYPPQWPTVGQRLNTAMDAYLNTPDLSLMDALHQSGVETNPESSQTPHPITHTRKGH
jgi:multiple sugar transport system substrate-binding protein